MAECLFARASWQSSASDVVTTSFWAEELCVALTTCDFCLFSTGISHLMRSLLREQKPQEAAGKGKTGLKAGGGPVGIHTLSPGMVLTPLLLEGATERNKAVFNVLCEQPETVAAFLVPRIRLEAS